MMVNAGWNSLVVQRSHKPQVVGSNPTPAPSPNGGMVDTADLESAALKSVEVRVFFWALDTAGNVRWYQLSGQIDKR